jgi:poly [ADP-ribose] polymerase
MIKSNNSLSKGCLIDEYCKHKDGVLVDKNNDIYTCTLNQTDLKTNKNKFYIMQLLQVGSQYVHYIRYGRIGEHGCPSYTHYSSANLGILAFEKQFRSKTGNKWITRQNFIVKSGKYFLSDISYNDELKNVDPNVKTKIDIPDSKLHQKVQNLILMISDINMMKNTLIQLDVDTKKMPLGKLSKSQLDKANEILISIQSKITILKTTNNVTTINSLNNDILDLSSKYYTYIPYSCGRRKPPMIGNNDILSKYKEIIDELKNIVVGTQIINNLKSTDKNQIDSIYDDINTTIKPLNNRCKIYKEITKWIKNTHGTTHSSKLEVLDIFDIEQNSKKKIYDEYTKGMGNRKLLFHGTPQSCILSIFKKDFYLDTSKLNDNKIQISGKMLSDGIYFADMATKSFNYTRAQTTNNIGCLIIGEVVLGNVYEQDGPNYSITKNSLAKQNFDSALGIGKWGPESSSTYQGVLIPNGQTTELRKKTYLLYNEYVVYDINQILIKFLVLVKNVGGSGGY